MGEDGGCVLSPHGLLVSAIIVPHGTPGWDACSLQGYISFFNNFNFFKRQETVNVLRLTSQQLNCPFALGFSQTFGKRKNTSSFPRRTPSTAL